MYSNNRSTVITLILIILGLFMTNSVFAHCQIPCGIYTDEMRIKMISEDIDTIEKSMKQIKELAGKDEVNYNQLVRWITNKDEHASKIQDVVNAYFLTQRIQLVDASDAAAYKEYTNKLVMLHQLIVYAMKCKQTVDLQNVNKLRTVLADFDKAYFGPAEKDHLKDHHK
jgi:nickel superoxide dismutase